MANNIHPTAIVPSSIKIGDNVKIGAYCVIGEEVEIGNNVELKSHVVIDGKTIIGDDCTFFPFASIGQIPQDKKYQGEDSRLVIGKNNIFREYTTVNPGTEGGGMMTKIGDNCLLMANSHVAHDCIIGNNVILANSVAIAGHVTIEDFVIIGGLSAVHQFVKIGAHAMIGGMSGIEKDVIPFGLVKGERASLHGINIIGLKRRGFEKDQINNLLIAYDQIFTNVNEATFDERLRRAKEEFANNEAAMNMINFIMQDQKPVLQPKM